ncbi:MAG: hypothetical protein Q9160_001140 [Pyrenula sp. 1 TL-2023]
MGAGSSKPEDSSHLIFSSETPVRFSQEFIDSLQASPELSSTQTDSSRAKTLELHIAQRVSAELEKLKKREDDALSELQKKISTSSSTGPTKLEKVSEPRLLSIADLTPPILKSPDTKAEEDRKRKISSDAVMKEIEGLKKVLGERKQVKEMPKDVESAREGVIACLRINDRRPLDCWEEVERFKARVREMEESFVGNVL